jgi:polysaccharide export outer membrane protein
MRILHVVRVLLTVLVVSGGVLGAQSTAPQQPPGQPGRSPGTTSDYTVGPNDVLKIQVFNEASLTGSYRVESDGAINYAVLGRIQVAGRTEREIAVVLERLLADGWIRQPQVAVQVDQFRSRTIFIAGEVRTPGKYPLQGDDMLLEVLAMAGSITQNASNDVVVLRPRNAERRTMPVLPDDGADAEVIRVDLQAIEQGRMSGNIQLQDGDTIFVPRAEKFYIAGYVRSPGAYPYVKGMTIQQAIAVAGGLTERGSNRRIKVRRVVAGEFKDIGVKLTDVIQPNDTITVPQRLI